MKCDWVGSENIMSLFQSRAELELRTQNRVLNDEVARLSVERDELKSSVNCLEDKLKEYKETVETQYTQQLNSKQAELEKAKQERDNLTTECTKARRELESLLDRYARLSNLNMNMESEIRALKECCEKEDREIKQLQYGNLAKAFAIRAREIAISEMASHEIHRPITSKELAEAISRLDSFQVSLLHNQAENIKKKRANEHKEKQHLQREIALSMAMVYRRVLFCYKVVQLIDDCVSSELEGTLPDLIDKMPVRKIASSTSIKNNGANK